MVPLKLYLFGSPRIELEDTKVVLPHRKLLAIFVYLVLTRKSHRRDLLATLFWPEAGQRSARAALRRELYVLTATLGQEWFVSSRESIGINPDMTVWNDVDEFPRTNCGLCKPWPCH